MKEREWRKIHSSIKAVRNFKDKRWPVPQLKIPTVLGLWLGRLRHLSELTLTFRPHPECHIFSSAFPDLPALVLFLHHTYYKL